MTALEKEQVGDIKEIGFDLYLKKPVYWD